MCRFYFHKYRLDFLALLLLVLTAPLFFYKLGQSSLVSWDEAWYAEIARNILKTGDFLNLTWNDRLYYDHPPAGFWLIALTFKIFGVSEFWARFTPALAGLASLFILYFLGKQLFGRAVGFTSALALSSSYWFLYRARSGNLDCFLTLFFLLSFLLALKASKNKTFFLPLSLNLAFLFLTKSLVPFTILPPLLIIFWRSSTFKIKNLWLPILVFIGLVGSWIAVQIWQHSLGFLQTYLSIGFPRGSLKTSYLDNLLLMKEYLHNGIGKWFWPGVLSLSLGIFFKQRRFFILTSFALTFSSPFIFSPKGHIWHLIPLHPILILAFFGFSYVVLERIFKQKVIIALLLITISGYFSFLQIRRMWFQFIDIPAYVSDEAILSKQAKLYPYPFFIDGDFLPAAVFYSEKKVVQIWGGGLPELFAKNKYFVLITYQWHLDQAGILKDKYRIIKTDRDKILVLKN